MRAKLIIVCTVTIIAIAASLWPGSTGAFFIRQGIIENNYLQAGRVSVALVSETGFLDLHRVIKEPGYTETVELALKNDGTIPLVIRLAAERAGSQPLAGTGYLPQGITITVRQPPATIFEENLATLFHDADQQKWFRAGSENVVIAAGDTLNLTLEFTLDPTGETEDNYQPFEGLLYFEAAQSDQYYWRAASETLILQYLPEEKTATTTSLGNSFDEITRAMIALIRERYHSTGSYGRTWGDYRYTDIGLMPGDWQLPIDRVYYTPSGSRLMVRPEEGAAFRLTDQSGTLRLLKASYNWNLVYDDLSEKWYFHSITDDNAVDINSLEIISE